MSTHALIAYKWALLAEALSRLIAPLLLLVLARLLTPVDFGVVAAATVLINLSQALADAGFGKALIQNQVNLDESANASFWITLGVGVLLTCTLFFLAPAIADYFRDERLTGVTRVLSLQVLFTAIATVPTSMLLKDSEFRELFIVRFTTALAPVLVAIPLALAGAGYWALVSSMVFGQLLQTIALWARSHWRPHYGIDMGVARHLSRFARWSALSSLLVWFYGWMDALIVARYLGAYDMGLYRTGNTLVMVVFGLLFAPVLPVAYSAFSRMQQNIPYLLDALRGIVKIISTISFPVGFFFLAFSPEIGHIALGKKWDGVGTVLAYMAVMHAFSWLVGVNGELYRAIGKPHVETWVTSLTIPLYLAGYLISIEHGLEHFLQARVALAIVALFIHLAVSRLVLGTTSMSKTVLTALLASVAALAIAMTLRSVNTTPALLAAPIAYALVIFATLGTFERSLIKRAAGWLKSGAIS